MDLVNSTSLGWYGIQICIFVCILARKYNFQSANIVKFLISPASVVQHERTQQSGATLSKQSRYELLPVNSSHRTKTEVCQGRHGLANTVQLCVQVHSITMPASTLWKYWFPHSDHLHIFCQTQINKALSMEVLICFKYTAKS